MPKQANFAKEIDVKGLLVINHFLKSEKFDEIHQWLLDAAFAQNVELTLMTNAEVIIKHNSDSSWLSQTSTRPDFVLYWDKDIRLAKFIESYGIRLFNSADSIDICDDKAKTYTTLIQKGFSMPKTTVIPMSYFPVDWFSNDILESICNTYTFPIILKECYGSFGEQVFLLNNTDELKEKMATLGNKPMIIQEFVESSFGRDIRINVVGDKVVASMYRYSVNGDFRANITSGGKMKSYEPTPEQETMAISACKAIGLDFGGVDILFGENDSSVLCEVNSNAHFKNIFDCTGINVADYIISYIKEEMDEV